MKNIQMKASTLSILMTIILILIAAFAVGGFYYTQGWLNDIAIKNKVTAPQSSTITGSTNNQSQIQPDTSNQKVVADKSIAMIATQSNYSTLIQQDLNKYATNIGVKIKDYSTTQAPTNNSSTTPLTNGVQSNYVKVTLENPVEYTNLIKFIKAIETNIPKMKIMSINITRSGNSGVSVTVDPIIIEVYTR